MKEFKSMTAYCKETGFPTRDMRRLVHSRYGEEFCFRSSGSANAKYTIDVQIFEKMLERGDFKEVLEG